MTYVVHVYDFRVYTRHVVFKYFLARFSEIFFFIQRFDDAVSRGLQIFIVFNLYIYVHILMYIIYINDLARARGFGDQMRRTFVIILLQYEFIVSVVQE